MTNEKITATVETAPVAEKKINLKKADKKAAETPAIDIEAKKADITAKINELMIRGREVSKINNKGSELNATNWSKDYTTTGNETLAGFVRGLLKQYADEINALKRDLKGLYFTLPPVLAELQKSENPKLVYLANICMDNMRDVVILPYRDYLNDDLLKELSSAEIERVGVFPNMLGDAIPVLTANGYMFESIAQPVTIEEKHIDGLDVIPACTYYSFKKAV